MNLNDITDATERLQAIRQLLSEIRFPNSRTDRPIYPAELAGAFQEMGEDAYRSLDIVASAHANNIVTDEVILILVGLQNKILDMLIFGKRDLHPESSRWIWDKLAPAYEFLQELNTQLVAQKLPEDLRP